MSRTYWGIAVMAGVAGLAALSVWGLGASQPSESGLLAYRDSEITARGAEIYAEYCAACHGASLEGEPGWRDRDADGYLPAPPHDPSGHTWHHPDQQLIEITRLGTERIVGGGYKSRMIGYAGILSEEEIRAVLAYIKSTWPEEIIDRHDRMNQEAAAR